MAGTRRKPLDRARFVSLSAYVDAVFVGPGRVILIRGGNDVTRLNEREVAKFVEAYADFQRERGVVEPVGRDLRAGEGEEAQD